MSAHDLAAIYDAHAQALFAFLLNSTRNEADARDVLQEIFCKIARNPSMLDGTRNDRAFLMRLAHNLAIDHSRRKQTRERYHEAIRQECTEVFAATANPDESTFREALNAALEGLGSEQRAVIHLKLWEGLTFEAIAEVLGIPLNTAASRYRYGIDKLRQKLRLLYDEIQ